MTVPEARRGQVYLTVGIFNVVLVLVGISLTLWISVVDRELRRQIAQKHAAIKGCERRVIVAPPPPMVDPSEATPPQDRPRDGYFGKQGTDIRPVLGLAFEAIRSGRLPTTPLEQIRLYSQDVLPRGTIQIVNLWAPWCEPCRDEMPDFKAMFAQRDAEWGAQVRFLPIMIQDAAEPGKAYADLERIMPPAPIKLADRAMGDPLAKALASDADRVLFKNALPVTLVLDCNRRVRWAHFAQLNEVDFRDLERIVDELRDELADTSPGSWCTQIWPGNGRCEARENTPGGPVIRDCGKPKRRPQDAAVEPPLAETTPSLPVDCPEGSEPTPDGRCKRKLRGNLGTSPPTKPVPSATCGNGVCDTGESRETCCDDCLCESPLVCKQVGEGPKRCMVKGLRGG